MAEVRKLKEVFSREELEMYFKIINDAKDSKATEEQKIEAKKIREKLIIGYIDLANAYAKYDYFKKFKIPVEELQLFAYQGLMFAIDHYNGVNDPYQYIGNNIYKFIYENACETRNIPINKMRAITLLEISIKKFHSQHQKEPSNSELAKIMNISEEKVNKLKKMRDVFYGGLNVQSNFKEDIFYPDESYINISDIKEVISDDSIDVEKEFFLKEFRIQIEDALKELDDKDRYIIKAKYGFLTGEELSYEKIGKSLGLTRERVRQRVQKAYNILSCSKAWQKLKLYLENSPYKNTRLITDIDCNTPIDRLYAEYINIGKNGTQSEKNKQNSYNEVTEEERQNKKDEILNEIFNKLTDREIFIYLARYGKIYSSNESGEQLLKKISQMGFNVKCKEAMNISNTIDEILFSIKDSSIAKDKEKVHKNRERFGLKQGLKENTWIISLLPIDDITCEFNNINELNYAIEKINKFRNKREEKNHEYDEKYKQIREIQNFIENIKSQILIATKGVSYDDYKNPEDFIITNDEETVDKIFNEITKLLYLQDYLMPDDKRNLLKLYFKLNQILDKKILELKKESEKNLPDAE